MPFSFADTYLLFCVSFLDFSPQLQSAVYLFLSLIFNSLSCWVCWHAYVFLLIMYFLSQIVLFFLQFTHVRLNHRLWPHPQLPPHFLYLICTVFFTSSTCSLNLCLLSFIPSLRTSVPFLIKYPHFCKKNQFTYSLFTVFIHYLIQVWFSVFRLQPFLMPLRGPPFCLRSPLRLRYHLPKKKKKNPFCSPQVLRIFPGFLIDFFSGSVKTSPVNRGIPLSYVKISLISSFFFCLIDIFFAVAKFR